MFAPTILDRPLVSLNQSTIDFTFNFGGLGWPSERGVLSCRNHNLIKVRHVVGVELGYPLWEEWPSEWKSFWLRSEWKSTSFRQRASKTLLPLWPRPERHLLWGVFPSKWGIEFDSNQMSNFYQVDRERVKVIVGYDQPLDDHWQSTSIPSIIERVKVSPWPMGVEVSWLSRVRTRTLIWSNDSLSRVSQSLFYWVLSLNLF